MGKETLNTIFENFKIGEYNTSLYLFLMASICIYHFLTWDERADKREGKKKIIKEKKEKREEFESELPYMERTTRKGIRVVCWTFTIVVTVLAIAVSPILAIIFFIVMCCILSRHFLKDEDLRDMRSKKGKEKESKRSTSGNSDSYKDLTQDILKDLLVSLDVNHKSYSKIKEILKEMREDDEQKTQ